MFYLREAFQFKVGVNLGPLSNERNWWPWKQRVSVCIFCQYPRNSPPSSPLCNTPADTVRWRKGSLVWSTNTWWNRSVIAAVDYRDASALISKPEGGYNLTKFQKFVSNGCAKISKFTNLTIFCWNLRRILHNFSPFFKGWWSLTTFKYAIKTFVTRFYKTTEILAVSAVPNFGKLLNKWCLFTLASSRAKLARQNDFFFPHHYTSSLPVNKSPAVYILSRALDGLWRENRRPLYRLRYCV